MPICDGVEACKRIRVQENKRRTPVLLPSESFVANVCHELTVMIVLVVALSADCQESTKQLCLSAGMNAFFSKPLRKGTLHFFFGRLFLMPSVSKLISFHCYLCLELPRPSLCHLVIYHVPLDYLASFKLSDIPQRSLHYSIPLHLLHRYLLFNICIVDFIHGKSSVHLSGSLQHLSLKACLLYLKCASIALSK